MTTISKPPTHAKQLSRPQLIANFDTDFHIDDKGQVTVSAEWQKQWLVPVSLPIPTGITHKVMLHKRAAPVFEAWFRSWTPEVCKTVKTFDGSFVPRLMRMAKNLPVPVNGDSYTKTWGSYVSRHTRGIAVDLCSKWNQQGKVPAARGTEGSVLELVELARQVRVPIKDAFGKTWTAGIVWGGDWSAGAIDGMHWELGSLPDE